MSCETTENYEWGDTKRHSLHTLRTEKNVITTRSPVWIENDKVKRVRPWSKHTAFVDWWSDDNLVYYEALHSLMKQYKPW